ncbi:MAG: TonB-dependent receptor, partial [Bacteroidales bacterium]|nr:TonB-dependent receptor [Bacteroidales bacterium]
VKVSYMSTNRTYRNRVMATASTGLMENGLAVTLSGSHRWAQEGYIEGTFYDAWACLLAVEKQFNKRHSLALTAFVAPNKRGKLIGSNQDAYDYLDNNFYNANWGYQNGEKRNSRIANTFKPFATLTHYWDINEKLKINTSLAYSFGRTGATALNWYDAKDPRPNYYKYLPYYNREKENYVWENTQVNWDYFYFANAKNLYTLSNVNGVSGNNVTFNRSKYIVEDRRVDHNQLKATVFADYDLNEDLKLSGNVNYTWYKGRHFKLVDDLLGGDYWVDVDQFAERDFDDPVVAQSNLDNPNRLTKVGDTFGYDYDANIQQIGGFVKADYTMGALDLYLGTQLSSTSFFRTGNMRTGKFPTESFGDSKKQNFFNYGVSLGANYKITGRHIVYANAKYTTRAPYFKNAYVSPRTRDHAVNNLTSEKIMSADLNYVIRLPFLTGRVSGYYSKFEDQTKIKSYFNDLNHSFINYTMTGIDNKHFGVEAALEGKITSELSVLAVAAIGQYTYDSRPDLSVTVDNSGEPPSTPSSKNPFLNKPNDGVVYLKNFYLPGMPQRAYSLGVKYSSPKFWWIEANANYFDKIYLDFHPARRVESAIIGLDPSIPTDADKIKAITQQEQLSSNFTVNISGGKSWKIGDYFLRLHAQVNNLLDNKSFATGGYEQARFDYAKRDLNKFSPNYFYAYGRNYMLILTFQF